MGMKYKFWLLSLKTKFKIKMCIKVFGWLFSEPRVKPKIVFGILKKYILWKILPKILQ